MNRRRPWALGLRGCRAARSGRSRRSSSAAAPCAGSSRTRWRGCPRLRATPPSSMPCGRARRSARFSGPSSWPSCRPTTARSTPSSSSRSTRAAGTCGRARTSSWSSTPPGSGTGGPARRSSRPRAALELPARYATYDQLIAATAMRGYEQGVLPSPLRGDFRAYGKVYRHLTQEQHAEAHLDRDRAPPRAELALRRRDGLGRRPARHVISTSLLSVPMTERLAAYADLIVRVGANVQPGQQVFVVGLVEHVPLVRAVTESAYAAGARNVDVRYVDQHVRRAFIVNAPEEDLSTTPPWELRRYEALLDGAAMIQFAGEPEPELFADLDQGRVGRARPLEGMKIYLRAVNERIDQLDDRRVPDGGPGAAGVRRAGRRAALGGGRARGASGRARPGRVVACARARSCGDRCQRADELALRRDPVHRPRNRSDRRPGSAALHWLGGGDRDAETGSATSRTCRRRRCSPVPTGAGPRARFARRGPSRSAAPSSATSSCDSRAASASR